MKRSELKVGDFVGVLDDKRSSLSLASARMMVVVDVNRPIPRTGDAESWEVTLPDGEETAGIRIGNWAYASKAGVVLCPTDRRSGLKPTCLWLGSVRDVRPWADCVTVANDHRRYAMGADPKAGSRCVLVSHAENNGPASPWQSNVVWTYGVIYNPRGRHGECQTFGPWEGADPTDGMTVLAEDGTLWWVPDLRYVAVGKEVAGYRREDKARSETKAKKRTVENLTATLGPLLWPARIDPFVQMQLDVPAMRKASHKQLQDNNFQRPMLCLTIGSLVALCSAPPEVLRSIVDALGPEAAMEALGGTPAWEVQP